MEENMEDEAEKHLDFADMLINMMIAAGDKNSMILKKSNNIIKILQRIEKEFAVKNNEKDVDQIIEFLEDKEKEIEGFYNALKGDTK